MTGEFPHSEKIARVVPIFKNGEVSDPSKYRPISILPHLGKIIERIVFRQVYPYLENNCILTSEQYGFRSGKTTSNAFVNFSNYVYGELDKGNYVFSLFLNFKKAFDGVSEVSDPSNYRPISILPLLGKIIEFMIKKIKV